MSFIGRLSLFMMSGIVATMVGFFQLRLTTRVLGPDDYGAYAIVTSVVLIGTSLNAIGVGYILAAQFPPATQEDRRGMVSTLLLAGLAATVAFDIVVIGAWRSMGLVWRQLETIPLGAVYLGALGLLLSYPWVVAAEVLTLERRAGHFAAITIAQSLVSAAVVLMGIFLLKWRTMALFAGSCAGAGVAGIGAVVALRSYLTPRVERRWLREIGTVGIVSTIGNFGERFYTTAESYVISSGIGLVAMGLFSHARQYRNGLMMGIAGFKRTIWPTTLSEARDLQGKFKKTDEAWAVIQLGLTVAGLLAVSFAERVIDWLTNGKFVAASPLVVIWVLVLLLQSSGPRAFGTVYAFNDGAAVSVLAIAGMGFGLIVLLLLAPRYGVMAAMGAMYLQHLVLRVGVQFRARRFRRDGFGDALPLAGTIIVAGAYAFPLLVELSPVGRLVLPVVMLAGTFVVFRRPAGALLRHSLELLGRSSRRALSVRD